MLSPSAGTQNSLNENRRRCATSVLFLFTSLHFLMEEEFSDSHKSALGKKNKTWNCIQKWENEMKSHIAGELSHNWSAGGTHECYRDMGAPAQCHARHTQCSKSVSAWWGGDAERAAERCPACSTGTRELHGLSPRRLLCCTALRLAQNTFISSYTQTAHFSKHLGSRFKEKLQEGEKI